MHVQAAVEAAQRSGQGALQQVGLADGPAGFVQQDFRLRAAGF